jgi:chorismate lyase/3-hydroxybenzoate synthase
MTQPESAPRTPASATPRIEYCELAPGSPLPKDVLAAVVFGNAYTRHPDPRCVRVGLKPLRGAGIAELWRAAGPVHIGFDGPIRYAADPAHLAAAIELHEQDCGGLAAAAQMAYAAVRRFQAQSPYPYLLRMWNYFDGINQGEGDAERYKQFCLGRAQGLEVQAGARLPAATAIGRRDGSAVLQVYWLAGRVPGVALENPRQTSAYRYPRQYGPLPPSFSRAMLVERRLLMISGTASIIGHVSHHPGDLAAQIDETLANLASVQQRAAALAPRLPASLAGGHSLLKIYLRDASAVEAVEARVRERLPAGSQYMILEADICRSELLVEIDCLHGGD